MAKLSFDDTDYSVVVKNGNTLPIRGGGRFIEPGDRARWAIANLFSHHGGRKQSRKTGTQAATGQAQHLAIAFSKISVEA